MATFDDIATNKHILDIANGIREITRTTEEMTIPEMPERITGIRVVEHREVEVSFNSSDLVVSLGVYKQDVKHLFIVTPKTSEDAKLLQRVKPEIKLIYEVATGELKMEYQNSNDSLVTLLVIDLLLALDDTTAGFLITQGGGGAIEPYNPDRAYEQGEMFLYNKGTEESPNYAVGITIEAHEAEAYDYNHSQVLATQINEDGDYLDLQDLAEQLVEGLEQAGEALDTFKEQYQEDKTTIEENINKKVESVNDVLPDGNKNVTLTGSDINLSPEIGKTIPKVFEEQGVAVSAALKGKISKVNSIGTTEESTDIVLDGHDIKVDKEDVNSPSLSERLLALNEALPAMNESIIEYVDEKDNLKQDKQDMSLNTDNKTVVGAINELITSKANQSYIEENYYNRSTVDSKDAETLTAAEVYADTGDTLKVNIADVVNNLLTTDTDKPLSALQGKILKELIEAKEVGRAYTDIQAMVTDLNAVGINEFRVAFNLLIVALDVPDFWVTSKSESSISYTYTTDEALIEAVKLGPVQIGHYFISLSETAKVDLTEYVKETRTIAGLGLSQDITKSALQSALDFNTKVDKVEGKGLSTNDYTTLEKNKLAGIEAGAQVNAVTSVAGRTGAVAVTKTDVGLGNVDNTSDQNKPISNAAQAALDTKQDELVSGVTIKTINNTSLLGSGDIEISPNGIDYLKDLDKTYLVIKTDIDNDTFELLTGTTDSPNYTIEWGDGTSEAVTTTDNPSHEYETAGMYLITISGNFENGIVYGFYANANKNKIIEVYGGSNYPLSIGNTAFYECTSLTTANFPKVTSIGSYAFYECTSLTTANFPKAKSVGSDAFYSCTSLTTANFPKVTSIGNFAFSGCTSLSTATFPEATSINSGAFKNGTSLKELTIGNVTTTTTGTRFENVKLVNLTIAQDVTDTDIERIKEFYADNGGTFIGTETKHGLQVEKTPTADNDVVRKIDLDNKLQTVSDEATAETQSLANPDNFYFYEEE